MPQLEEAVPLHGTQRAAPRPVGAAEPANAIQKVCAVLRVLSGQSPARLATVAAAAGLNKVTALRILDTLAREGFVTRAAGGHGFERGPEFLALAASAGRSHDLRELARPSLVRLADLSEDTALLSLRSGVEAVCVDREVGSFPIRANYLDVGSRRPLGAGAGAMALLAWLPEREIDAVLAVLGPRLAGYPRLPVGEIRRLAGESRAAGRVVMLDHVLDRMGAIGAPVRDASGTVVAALSIAALSERIRDRADVLAAALARETNLIEREMRGGAP